VFLYFL